MVKPAAMPGMWRRYKLPRHHLIVHPSRGSAVAAAAADIRDGRRAAVEIAADATGLADVAGAIARVDAAEIAADAVAATSDLGGNFPLRSTRRHRHPRRDILRTIWVQNRPDRKVTFRWCCQASRWRNSGTVRPGRSRRGPVRNLAASR